MSSRCSCSAAVVASAADLLAASPMAKDRWTSDTNVMARVETIEERNQVPLAARL